MKQNGKKHTTIHDVARLAGVSVASVSYAINGINKITPATRQHIFDCMENQYCSALSFKRSFKTYRYCTAYYGEK